MCVEQAISVNRLNVAHQLSAPDSRKHRRSSQLRMKGSDTVPSITLLKGPTSCSPAGPDCTSACSQAVAAVELCETGAVEDTLVQLPQLPSMTFNTCGELLAEAFDIFTHLYAGIQAATQLPARSPSAHAHVAA